MAGKRVAGAVYLVSCKGKVAFEGYKSHGVFIWVLLDALRHSDVNGNGTVELSEFAAPVQNMCRSWLPSSAARHEGSP